MAIAFQIAMWDWTFFMKHQTGTSKLRKLAPETIELSVHGDCFSNCHVGLGGCIQSSNRNQELYTW